MCLHTLCGRQDLFIKLDPRVNAPYPSPFTPPAPFVYRPFTFLPFRIPPLSHKPPFTPPLQLYVDKEMETMMQHSQNEKPLHQGQTNARAAASAGKGTGRGARVHGSTGEGCQEEDDSVDVAALLTLQGLSLAAFSRESNTFAPSLTLRFESR
jgi:hypothetical protein